MTLTRPGVQHRFSVGKVEVKLGFQNIWVQIEMLNPVVMLGTGRLAPMTSPTVALLSLLGVMKMTRGQKVMERGRVHW